MCGTPEPAPRQRDCKVTATWSMTQLQPRRYADSDDQLGRNGTGYGRPSQADRSPFLQCSWPEQRSSSVQLLTGGWSLLPQERLRHAFGTRRARPGVTDVERWGCPGCLASALISPGAECSQLIDDGTALNFARLAPRRLRATPQFPLRDQPGEFWNEETGDRVRTLKGHRLTPLGAHFNRDGSRLVTSESNRTAIVWDVATGRQLTRLTGTPSRGRVCRLQP